MSWTFNIGALPRSGSAWIATLLNMHPNVFCFHDALNTYDGPYTEAPLSKPGYDHVGDCSSGACLFVPPDRSAFIARRREDVKESLEAVGLAGNFEEVCNMCAKWAFAYCDKDTVFQFKDIFSDNEEQTEAALKKLFHVVVPGVRLKMDKVRLLRPLKVELFNLGPDYYNTQKIAERMK